MTQQQLKNFASVASGMQLTGYTYGGVMGTIQRLRKDRHIREVEERLVGNMGRPTKFYTWR